MKKYLCILAVLLGFMASNAYSQLPSNPWQPKAPTPNDGYFGDNLPEAGPNPAPTSPEYQEGPTDGYILPVDPWSRARDRTNTRTWRQSGSHGRLNYVGEGTTYTDAQGQEMIAPEVNRHNMLIMTEHLRRMGYKIPASYDQKIRDMPQAYGRMLRENYNKVQSANDPFGRIFNNFMTDVEQGTGLDFENLLFNSVDLLSTD